MHMIVRLNVFFGWLCLVEYGPFKYIYDTPITAVLTMRSRGLYLPFHQRRLPPRNDLFTLYLLCPAPRRVRTCTGQRAELHRLKFFVGESPLMIVRFLKMISGPSANQHLQVVQFAPPGSMSGCSLSVLGV